MGKPWKLSIVALAGLFVCAIAWKVLTPREPIYEGKPLSSWLQVYDPINANYNSPEWLKANAAVRHAGTNAIPTLLRMLRATDSRWKLKLYGLVQRQSFIKITYTPASSSHHQATEAFYCLGARADSAVSPLVEIYNSEISPSSQSATAYALGAIGPTAKDAVPSLLRGATNTNRNVRSCAMMALGQIHADPFLVMPVLLKGRRDPATDVKNAATWAILSYESEAMRAVSALFESLQDSDEKVRRQATNALKEIYPEASARAGLK
ncbi:HEAT repeat domain-containing protein [Pedosphaera parvula]|uniref:HEAT domain containing protein n=1 Tax=Pedosphaera parvula (strain Ellin514) TaxID=320771 RepID=B9XQS8_PEDPL|nr:HEAT repeat domain-containing protein [Pedosphaera parvula]EEF57785.1 HEAT domain containing protein [Pedosphaera parvula Ellin514]